MEQDKSTNIVYVVNSVEYHVGNTLQCIYADKEKAVALFREIACAYDAVEMLEWNIITNESKEIEP